MVCNGMVCSDMVWYIINDMVWYVMIWYGV